MAGGTFYAVPGESLDWSATGTWEGAAVPDSDAATFVVFKSGGYYRFTAGLNQASVNIARLIAEPGSRVDFAEPLQIDVNRAERGVVWQASDGRLLLNGATNVVSIERPVQEVRLSGGAHAYVQAVNGSRVAIGSGATVGIVAASKGGVVDIASHGSDRVDEAIINDGGAILTYRSVESGDMARGALALLGGAGITDGSSGGILRMHDPQSRLLLKNTSGPTIKLVRCHAGTIDPSEAKIAITIDATQETPLSNIILNYPSGPLVITARTQRGISGGLTNQYAQSETF